MHCVLWCNACEWSHYLLRIVTLLIDPGLSFPLCILSFTPSPWVFFALNRPSTRTSAGSTAAWYVMERPTFVAHVEIWSSGSRSSWCYKNSTYLISRIHIKRKELLGIRIMDIETPSLAMNACTSCKQRKRKCNKILPICSTCARYNLRLQYTQKRLWLNN